MNPSPVGRQLSIAAYRPKPGKEEELLALAREHLPILRAQGLTTARTAIAGQAADGTVIEVFEWEDGGIDRAHSNPNVLKLWERYGAVCDFVPLNTLAETADMFAGFTPIDL